MRPVKQGVIEVEVRPFRGAAEVPPDKSMSHRALMLAAMSEGESSLSNLLNSQDVRSTVACLRSLGAGIEIARSGAKSFDARVAGWGESGPASPAEPLDCGNSGTTTRLLLGILSSYRVDARLEGDASLSRRPMQRVTEPLSAMGARFDDAAGNPWEGGSITLPLAVHGTARPRGIDFFNAKASAQVKTAILLAGLRCSGTARVEEPHRSRNHTELMLPAFGARVEVEGLSASVGGGQRLHPCDVRVPGDPSSAMFPVVAAALVPGSDVTVRGVGLNPTRIAALEAARRMGCDIDIAQGEPIGGEPVGDVRVRYAGGLSSTEVMPDEVPALIDEVPILALLATAAEGATIFHEVGELRVKESNRLRAVVEGLSALGCRAREEGDDLVVEHSAPSRSLVLDPLGDHRLAMTWTLANRCFGLSGGVADASCIDVSYPDFLEDLDALQG